MQTSNANKHGTSNDPVWQFLAEYPLNEFLSNHKGGGPTAGLLFQTTRELGIPSEYLENIEMSLTGFAKGVLEHFKQESLELPGRIRIFCQKRMRDEANSAKTTRPVHAEQTMKHAPIVYHTSTIIKGGWGYFIIERSSDDAGSLERTCPLVDLYLYKEGE